MVQASSSEFWQGIDVEQTHATVPAGEIAVAMAGNGPALVMLHGITSSGAGWRSVVSELAERFRLVVIDQRGHGRSHRPESGYALEDYADDLDAVLSFYGLERPLIIGHSLGGMVTLEWARRHPGRAAALVIEDSPLRHGGPDAREMFENWLIRNDMPLAEAEAWFRATYPALSDLEVRRRAEGATGTTRGVFTELRDQMLAREGRSVVDQYAVVTSPVLLIHGDIADGGMVQERDAAAFKRTVVNAETGRIAGGGHNLHHDRPDEFLALAVPFLERHAAGVSWIGGRDQR